jgi:hypothetical protein
LKPNGPRRLPNRGWQLILASALLIGCAVLLAVRADATEAAAEVRTVDQDVQALKKELVDLNRDLFRLEEELLYPASTQVAVFLSVNVGTFFALDSVQLKVDGKEVASQKMERTIPLILQWDENLDVGSDTGTPVNDADYKVPFKFTGKLERITLTIDRPQLTPEDIKKLSAAQQRVKAEQ